MKRSAWKWIVPVLIAVLMLAAVSGAAAEQSKKYTVMLYVCGADLERDNGQESASLADILATRYNAEEINVIGLLGGTTRWAGNRFDPSVLSIVNVSGRRPSKVDEMPLGAMSDPATLTGFLNYCREKYPAEHYILVISDHGGGPLLGCCVDYLFDRSLLSVNNLSKALADSEFAGRGLDTIAFDCCLMGSLEISNSLAPFAQYMVATEDAMYGLGHEWLAGLENDASALDTAKRIADSTYLKNEKAITAQKASQLNSVSVIDLEKVPGILPALNDYFENQPTVDQSNFTAIANRRRDGVDFGVTESGGNSQYDLVDVGSLVKSFGADSELGSALMEKLQEAVPFHVGEEDRCLGLTIYHPSLNQKTAAKSMETYAGLNFAPAYVDYVIEYTAVMTGQPLANWANLLTQRGKADKAVISNYTLELNEEQAANYGSSRMKVLWKNEDGSFTFTGVSGQTEMSDGKVTGTYNGMGLYAVDADGNPISGVLPYSLAQDGTVLIPAELSLPAEDGQESAVHQALVYCEMDQDTKNLTPGGVLVWDEAMSCWTGSFQTSFSDYSSILIHCISRREPENREESLLPFDQWEAAEDHPFEHAIGEDWSFRMVDVMNNRDELYVSFEVQDSQANQYASIPTEMVPPVPKPDIVSVIYDNKDLLTLDHVSLSVMNQLTLTGEVTNLTDTEMIVTLGNLQINGKAFDQTAEVYGNGENWGLLKDETQMLNLFVPMDALEGEKEITSIDFELTVTNAADNSVLNTVPVSIVLVLQLS